MNLFDEVVPAERQHRNFKAMKSGLADAEREVLAQWADGFVDRDGKFVTEFQTTFNSSFWELYLHAAFRELGFACDFTHPAPDFMLESSEQRFCAEAVIAAHADGYKPEWYRSLEDFENIDPEAVLHLATIRLANAIWTKYKKYVGSYAQLPHVAGLPFVICVAPFEQPLFFMQNDHALRRVLYGFDQPLWLPGDGENERMIVGEAVMDDVVKDSGATIPLGFFARPQMPEVSAVIFSNTATFGKLRALAKGSPIPVIFMAMRYNEHGTEPYMIRAKREEYEETLLDGLHVCLNPFATHLLDATPFGGREMSLHVYDPSTGEYLPMANDGFLFQRGCIAIAEEGKYSHLAEIPDPADFKAPAIPTWPEGELQYVGGQVMSFVDNHLAHYRGWTICVVRCSIDDDWGGQAVPGTFRTLGEYHRADKSGEHLLPTEWYATKEEAFADIRQQVDAAIENGAK